MLQGMAAFCLGRYAHGFEIAFMLAQLALMLCISASSRVTSSNTLRITHLNP